jgi:hypothetical protein
MKERLSAPSARRRIALLALGWTLLATSLLLCLVGPHLSDREVPADIKNRMGDADWIGLAWVISGVAVGVLALVCFAAEWALRPGRQSSDRQQKR